MRTRFLIVAIAVALLIAIALGIAYAMLRSDVRARQDRTARYCSSDVLGEMHFYGEALRVHGTDDSSRERLLSPERDVAKSTLRSGYRYCLLMAGVEPAQTDQWALRLSLNMSATSVDKARQALDEAIERLRSHGY